MSAQALHLNLLNPQERMRPASVRLKVILPIVAALVMVFVLMWTGFLAFQLLLANRQVDDIRSEIREHARQAEENAAQLAKFKNVRAEADQYAYYLNGRVTRGELLKRLADAIPEGITLMSLELPVQEPQDLRLAPNLPPLQGPTQTVERVELRLKGLAQKEEDVFRLMDALKGNAFTGLVSIVEQPSDGERQSPRVQAFRQESSPAGGDGHRDVFFDVVYDLKPREFVK